MDCAGGWLFLPLADLRHLLRCLAQGFGSWPWDPNLAWLMNIILCPSVLLMRIAMYCLYLCNFYVIVYCCSVWSCFCGFLALVAFWLLDILASWLGFYGSVAYVLAARTIVQTTSEALERIKKKHNVQEKLDPTSSNKSKSRSYLKVLQIQFRYCCTKSYVAALNLYIYIPWWVCLQCAASIVQATMETLIDNRTFKKHIYKKTRLSRNVKKDKMQYQTAKTARKQ